MIPILIGIGVWFVIGLGISAYQLCKPDIDDEYNRNTNRRYNDYDIIEPTNINRNNYILQFNITINDHLDHDELLECSICLDYITSEKSKLVKCGHIYHYKCIKEWIKYNINIKSNIYACPLCRSNMLI